MTEESRLLCKETCGGISPWNVNIWESGALVLLHLNINVKAFPALTTYLLGS